jgi:hypothetical protein
MWKCLKFKSYKNQLLQHVNVQDFLSRLEDDELFIGKIVFSDEATFHLWIMLINIT